MFLSQEARKLPCSRDNAAGGPYPPEFLALKRHSQFYKFLLDELEACRTETERGVVLSALLSAQTRIRRLERTLSLLERAEA